MNECLFCKLTDWLSSLDWNFLFPYFLVLFFVIFLFFGIGYIVGVKDYNEVYEFWLSERDRRESLEKDMGL